MTDVAKQDKRRPATQFYWADWLRDPGLRSCSLAARGLWMDMLAYMHHSETYGELRTQAGRPMTNAELARMVGDREAVIRKLLVELEAAGVPGKTQDGAYFSRRLVRENEAYREYVEHQSESGKAGAKQRWNGVKRA